MKLTAKVKLLCTPEQASTLKKTLETANEACNHISGEAWKHKTFQQFPLHNLAYYAARQRYPLSAQVVVRCISRVADAYKTGRQGRRLFKPHSSIAFDERILSWRMSDSTVSLWSVDGRQRIPFACGERQRRLLQGQRGESDLCLIAGTFYLFATCEVETPAPVEVSDVLGVDLGIVNLAVDSDGKVYSSAQVNGLRYRHRRLRQKLQRKGTRSVKRLLKKRSGREARFASDVNHTVSKRIVAVAQGTGRGIALEDLTGIRSRITARKPQRATLHGWSFFQLRAFLEYKARRLGLPLVLVDPRNTSRTCPVCGHIDQANRVSQSTFSCVACGFSGPADHIAALNIRVLGRAAVNRPNVSDAADYRRSARDKPLALAMG